MLRCSRVTAGGGAVEQDAALFRRFKSVVTSRSVRLCVLGLVLAVQAAMLWPARAEEPFDRQIRAAMLARSDGQVAHLETVYSDIFVAKYKKLLKMAFQLRGSFFHQSEVNLAEPEDLPLLYPRAMSLAAIYPPEIKRVLVLGLGGGSLPVYLDRFLPDATIDTVELDPAVILVAKKYFGLRETNRVRFIESDARVFLNRHPEPYDVIMVDAFNGSYIPFHLMTKEFYQLLRGRLAPHGAVAFNILPSVKLFESNVRTLKLVFDNLEFFDSGDQMLSMASVIVVDHLDPLSEAEQTQRAAAAQARYKFRFDVSQLIAKRRIPSPDALKGEVLTDDFAPADVLDALGRQNLHN